MTHIRVFKQVVGLALGLATVQPIATAAEVQPERLWLAGRYDGNRIVVYFDAVKFEGSVPSQAEKIPCPVQAGFFCPVKLPPGYIAQFQKNPNTEHFSLGDKYDLIVGGNSIAAVTLTTLVGYESDEPVGNDSFIGALATLEKDKEDWLSFTKGYLVLRRHRELPYGGIKGKAGQSTRTIYASLSAEPVRFDIQSKIFELLVSSMKTTATDAKRHEAERVSPLFAVQQFRLADGSLRYYARAGWKSAEGPRTRLIYALGAWVAPLPTLHVQAAESRVAFDYVPELLDVVDLGDGKTALIISGHGDDSGSLSLVEFRDGVELSRMRILQSIGSAE